MQKAPVRPRQFPTLLPILPRRCPLNFFLKRTHGWVWINRRSKKRSLQEGFRDPGKTSVALAHQTYSGSLLKLIRIQGWAATRRLVQFGGKIDQIAGENHLPHTEVWIGVRSSIFDRQLPGKPRWTPSFRQLEGPVKLEVGS